MAVPLDDIDRRILAALSHDGRMSIRTLAESLHISRANAYARIQRLRDTNVIRGFRADIDHVAAGMGTSAYLTVTLRQNEWRVVAEQLRALPGVVHIALVGGDFDVIMLVRVRDNTELRRVVLDAIQGMPGVVSTRTLLVFEEAEPHNPAPAWEGQ